MTTMAAHEHHQPHHEGHGHVHVDEAHWQAWAADTERMGELFLSFVTDTAAWVVEVRGSDAPPVRRIIDIGSGPGVGTCELARLFPDAHVIAVDSSPAMLERVAQRAAERGLQARVSTHIAELPAGLDGLGDADLIWASMSLHHVGDEVAALRILRDLLDLLDPHGLIAIAEFAEPMRVLPDDLDVGRPGLVDRLHRVGAAWFAAMREGLPESVPSRDLPTMLTSASLEVIGSRVARKRFDAPLSDDARLVAFGHLDRTRQQVGEQLDDDDLGALDVLLDADDPRGAMHRSDLFVESSQQIVIARPN
jgi:SAM-dependent methyltransferase